MNDIKKGPLDIALENIKKEAKVPCLENDWKGWTVSDDEFIDLDFGKECKRTTIGPLELTDRQAEEYNESCKRMLFKNNITFYPTPSGQNSYYKMYKDCHPDPLPIKIIATS